MPKFFVTSNQIQGNEIAILGEDVKHILQVLRANIGEELLLCNKETGLNYITKISQIQTNSILCTITDCVKPVAESNIEITVFQGLPKADKMEYIIQKNTELGVKKIVPVSMERSIVKLEAKNEIKKLERWQKIAESAAKQSGRDKVPEVEKCINIQTLLKQIPEYNLVLLAYENEKENTLKKELKKYNSVDGLKIGIIIGPEGGIDEKEVKLLQQAGAKTVTIGKRILRTETASIVITSNILYEYEM